MSENLRLARFFFLLLAIVTVGRWTMSLMHVPYAKGTDKLSIVILTLFSSIYYAAFARRWRSYGIGRAVVLTMTLAVCAQLVIFLSTIVSYAAGLDTYFTYPTALLGPDADLSQKVPLGQALVARLLGLVVNTLLNAVAGALGWTMGGLLPEK